MLHLRIKTTLLLSLLLLIVAGKAQAQEFNCTVSVIAPTVQVGNPQILKSMETSIREFMNNRRWTNDKFDPMERIECNILINISNVENNSEYTGTIQVSASRPVYGMNYKSGTLNFQDQNFSCVYVEFQPMEYQEGVYTSELTSILAYYANLMLGYDYDSFSELGGTPFFQKAMNIVNAAQSSSGKGWSAMEKNQRNRYYIANQLVDDRYTPFRKAFYTYHRLGLDLMQKDNEQALNNVMKSLTQIQELYKNYPINNMPVSLFFEVKYKELIDLFSQAPTSLKTQAKTLLTSVDVGRSSKYEDGLR